MDMAPAFAADDVERGGDQVPPDGVPGYAVMRVDDVLEGPTGRPPGQLGVAHRMTVTGFGGDQAGEALPSAQDQVEPFVLPQGLVAVGLRRQVQQLLDGRDLTGVHGSLHFHLVHSG